MVISLFILCFASTLAFSSTNKEQQLEVLSDSISKKIGQKDFIPFYQEYMRLARQQNDTARIDDAYSLITSHYYRLRNTDSLKVVAYEYMDWCLKHGNVNNRYTQWRQYIQLLTEKGLQDEAMRETELLQKDADAAKSAFGMACSEMCIGYNHRVFSNNVKLCLEYYSSALKHFSDAGFYEDAYVVSLNIIQTHLAREEYANAIEYLNCMPGLIEKMKRKDIPVRPELTMRYYQFQVIATLALKGKKEAQPFIAETDKFYHESINAFPREGWLGYKILCARTLNDNQMALNYLDSLMDYHHSVGSCYPANHLLKAQFMEQMGRFEDACEVYKSYAHINDSIRSAELDEQLGKYTVQFEVDKLEHDKLELRAEVNRNLFITLTFNIPQLHNQPLFFGKLIHQAVYQSHPFFTHQPFVRARRIGSIFHIGCQFHRPGIFPFAAVYCQVPCHCQAISLNRSELRPLVTFVPHPNQCFLHNIFRFRPVKCNSQG